jgi:hypothetical protein
LRFAKIIRQIVARGPKDASFMKHQLHCAKEHQTFRPQNVHQSVLVEAAKRPILPKRSSIIITALASTLAALAIGHAAPPAFAGKTYLIVPDKPTIEVLIPVSPANPNPPLTPPRGTFKVMVVLSQASLDWLVDADEHPTFNALMVRFDTAGKVQTVINLAGTTITSIGFQAMSLARGGISLFNVSLTPTAASVSSLIPGESSLPPSPVVRITGYELYFGTKLADWVTQLTPFSMLKGATDFSGSITTTSGINVPAGYATSGPGRLGLKIQTTGRPPGKLNLRFTSGGVTRSAEGRAVIRLNGVRFERG